MTFAAGTPGRGAGLTFAAAEARGDSVIGSRVQR
jgi:hypothetical protein